MGEIQYDFAEIEARMASIVAISKSIEAVLDEVSADVATLASRWEGEAQESWHAEQAAWDAQARQEKDDLKKLADTATQASANMRDTEKDITKKFEA